MLLEDDENLNRGIALKLQKEGYQVFSAFQISEAEKLFDENRIDLVISDITLPDGNGLEFCRKIRNKSKVFVLFLTAMDSEIDMVNGYDAGADDYITKPFSITEVMARIKANIRRNTEYAAVQPEQTKLVWGPLVMNLENHTVTKSGELIELTAKEFDILRLLLENPQRVYTKAQIYSLIWNDAYMGDENAVNVHISRLRTKIEDDPRKPQVVITVWGIGYKLGEQK